MRAKVWWVLGALVLLGGALLLLRPGARPAPRAAAPTADEPAPASAAPVAAAPPAPGRAPTSGGSGSAGPEPDPRYEHRNDRVSQALALLRFPPTSQPLRSDMKDVLQPNRRWESPLPLLLAQGGSAKDPPRDDLSYELTGDVFTVLGGGSLVASLEVFHARDHRRVPVEITRTALVAVDGGKTLTTGLPLVDDGEHVYRATITPSALDGLATYRGALKLEVGFVASEGDHRPAEAALDFRYAAGVPATFTGVAGEKLVPEGLEIDVALSVTEAGQYFVQGCLFDGKGEPIGFAVARPQLQPGARTVPLVFFGLLFHDANASGPYVFKTLTGNRMPAPGEADHAAMDGWPGTYTTRAYTPKDFSDHEWESPQKDAKIDALGDLATKGRARPAASGN